MINFIKVTKSLTQNLSLGKSMKKILYQNLGSQFSNCEYWCIKQHVPICVCVGVFKLVI